MYVHPNRRGVWLSEMLSKQPAIFHGVSDKTFGNMVNRPMAPMFLEGRRLFARALHFRWENTWTPKIVHGSDIGVISRKPDGGLTCTVHVNARPQLPASDFSNGFDGLITKEKVVLGVFAADCAPILFFDYRNKVIGVAHAGLSGAILGIAGHTVRVMGEVYGSKPENVLAVIGPRLCANCFNISKSHTWNTKLKYLKPERVIPNGAFRRTASGIMFDISSCVAMDLVENGVPEHNIEVSDLCTRCQYESFFSNCVSGMKSKHDQEREGRFTAILGLRDPRQR